jgi:TrmH family RNA methyltransferase
MLNQYPLIESLQNPKVKNTVRLRDRRHRDEEKRTVLEGYRELSRAFEYGWPLETVFFCPSFFLGGNEFSLLERISAGGVPVFEVKTSVLEKIAYRDRPEGLIAVAPILEKTIDDIPSPPKPLYIVAENLEKPGNLGTILRTADAAGADGVIICDKRTDLFNPNVLRASAAAVFAVPAAECPGEMALEWLRARGVRTVSASPSAKQIYTELDMTGPLAVVVGAEQYGLSRFWLENSDFTVRIPMLGKMDSLNVSAASAVILYEAARQRNWKKSGA